MNWVLRRSVVISQSDKLDCIILGLVKPVIYGYIISKDSCEESKT